MEENKMPLSPVSWCPIQFSDTVLQFHHLEVIATLFLSNFFFLQLFYLPNTTVLRAHKSQMQIIKIPTLSFIGTHKSSPWKTRTRSAALSGGFWK